MKRIMTSLWAMMPRPSGRPARFQLVYHPPDGRETVVVGHLRFEDGTWTFEYDSEFKARRGEFHPLEGFDKFDDVYTSRSLFPFFAVRIPDVQRPDVQRRLREDHLRDPEPTDLLRLFGRRVVSSPGYELLPT